MIGSTLVSSFHHNMSAKLTFAAGFHFSDDALFWKPEIMASGSGEYRNFKMASIGTYITLTSDCKVESIPA